MPEQFTVSAIVSVWKAARFLPHCLEDLLAQSLMPRLEIVVIDSASPEGEGDIVERYRRQWPDNIVYLRTAERESIYAAWNRGAKLARGRYLTNANADDRHAPHAYEAMAAALDADPGAAMAYANSAITMEYAADFASATLAGRTDWPAHDPRVLAQYNYLGPQPMWRASVHQTHGYFDRDFQSAGDYEFWLRLAAGGERFVHLPEVLGLYYMRPDSAERRDKPLSQRETRLARARHRTRLAERCRATA